MEFTEEQMGNPTLKYTNDLSAFQLDAQNRTIGTKTVIDIQGMIDTSTTLEELETVPDSIKQIAGEIEATNYTLIEPIGLSSKEGDVYPVVFGHRRILGGLYLQKRGELTGEPVTLNFSYTVNPAYQDATSRLQAQYLENSSHEKLSVADQSRYVNRAIALAQEEFGSTLSGKELSKAINDKVCSMFGMAIGNVRIYRDFQTLPEHVQSDIMNGTIGLFTVAKIASRLKKSDWDFITVYNSIIASAESQGVTPSESFSLVFVENLLKSEQEQEQVQAALEDAPETVRNAVELGDVDQDVAAFATMEAKEHGLDANEIIQEATVNTASKPDKADIQEAVRQKRKKVINPVLDEADSAEMLENAILGLESISLDNYDTDGLRIISRHVYKTLLDASAFTNPSREHVQQLIDNLLGIEIEGVENRSAHAYNMSTLFENKLNNVKTIQQKEEDDKVLAEKHAAKEKAQKERDAKKAEREASAKLKKDNAAKAAATVTKSKKGKSKKAA